MINKRKKRTIIVDTVGVCSFIFLIVLIHKLSSVVKHYIVSF